MEPLTLSSSLSYATHYLHMLAPTLNSMANGTGFIYEYKGEYFMITNSHNVTRINSITGERLSQSAAFPIAIETKARKTVYDTALTLSNPLKIELYKDEDFKNPYWLMHPIHGYNVDVVAIPIEKISEIPIELRFFPINKFHFDDKYSIAVSDDVFILGYPYDIKGGMEFPIWKRGTVSTEPALNLYNLPIYLVDTATRPGMSGSPVIMMRNGFHTAGKELSLEDVVGTITVFAGIYSGRIKSSNENDPQLGIVWKPSVIEEIITGNTIGGIEFQKN